MRVFSRARNIVSRIAASVLKNPSDDQNAARANKNADFTLIARDCVCGVLYHQLGLKFRSPTINLFFTPEDFNWFCPHLKQLQKLTLDD